MGTSHPAKAAAAVTMTPAEFHAQWKAQQARVAALAKTNPIPNYSTHFDPPPPLVPGQRPALIVDTDIGSDIDDAMALVLLLHLPKEMYDLLGIVTVYGWVEVRKAVTERLLEAAGRDKDVPVVAGISTPMFSPEPVWHTGHEGEFVSTLKKCLAEHRKVTIVAIGALTNLAVLYRDHPVLAKDTIERLVAVGGGVCQFPQFPGEGEISPDKMELGKAYSHVMRHNVKCDVRAASLVISTAASWQQPILFVTSEVTYRLWIEGARLSSILESSKEHEEDKVLGRLARTWLDYRASKMGEPPKDSKTQALVRKTVGTFPHDPVAMMESVAPGTVCKYKRGWFYVHPEEGYTMFVPDPFEGPHYGSVDIDPERFLQLFLQGLAHQLRTEDIASYNST